VNVPLLLLLLLLLDGRSSTNERLLWLLRIHHVRMDRLEIALRSVHLHRLLLLLDLLVLDNIGSVRMLEMLLLLLLGMLNLPLMQVKVLLLTTESLNLAFTSYNITETNESSFLFNASLIVPLTFKESM
jgi:hypothetical protein